MPEVSGVTSGFGFTYDEPKTNELGQEAFLNLLTTQLQYQDPLNPQSDTEFIAQLAQFSSLEQLRSVNANLDTIELYQISLNNSNALHLVGKEVNISDAMMEHEMGQTHEVKYTVPAGAETITVTVHDENGREVYTQELDGTEPGESEFIWQGVNTDGEPVADGTYTISVKAFDGDGNSIDLNVLQRRKVDGLAYENGQILLIVGDRKLPIDGVSEVFGGSSSSAFGGLKAGTSFKNDYQTAYQPGLLERAYRR
ncbi:MAG: hypothetical protein CSA81_03550 [Acidobacteria bacterium]|nr:MAG: hypothetical protein CSA81_03550 [Acidobacteriota bacterium]